MSKEVDGSGDLRRTGAAPRGRSASRPARRLTRVVAAAVLVAWAGWGCGPRAEAPIDREATIQEAVQLLNRGEAEPAIEVLKPLVSQPEVDFEAYLLYGRALLGNGQGSLAIWPIERLKDDPRVTPQARALFVQALLYGGADAEAIREATRILDENPGASVVRKFRSEAYHHTLQREEALEDLSILVDESPGDLRLLEQKIDLLTEMERFDEARVAMADLRDRMETAEVEDAVRAHFCAAAARFEYDRGDAELALEQLDACVARFPKEPPVLLSKFDVLDWSGRKEEATAWLEQAAEQAKGRFRVQTAWAQRLIQLGRHEEVEAVFLGAAETVGGAAPYLSLADYRIQRGDPKGAAKAVVEGIRSQLGRGPGDPGFAWTDIPSEAQFAFGDVFVTAGEYDRAREIIEVVDQEAYRLLLEARLAFEQGDAEGALALYEEAFKLWPANSGARYLAAQAAMQLGQFDRATFFYQDALRADGTANDAGLVLARMYLAQGLPGGTVDILATYSHSHPDDPHALRLFARAAFMAGLVEHGEQARALLATDLDWAGIAIADQARDVVRMRGLADGRAYLEKSPELESPPQFEALSAWVDLSAQLGDLEAAAARVQRLRERNPEAPGHAVVWGRVLLRRERAEDARKVFEDVVARAPTLRAGHLGLGEALAALGEVDAAVASFERAHELDPLEPDAARRAAEVLLEAGRMVEGRARLERFVRAQPWHGGAALRLARLRREAGDPPERTRALAEQAVRFHVEAGPEAFGFLAGLQLEAGDAAAAVETLARRVQLGGATPSDRYALARARLEAGDREGARRELRALVAGPAFPEREEARAALDALAETGAG